MRGNKFGEVIKNARIERGFTLRKFAERCGKSPTYISRIERSDIDVPPSLETIELFCGILNLDTDDMVIMAGKIPADIPHIINSEPRHMTTMLRAVKGKSPEELDAIIKQIESQNGDKA